MKTILILVLLYLLCSALPAAAQVQDTIPPTITLIGKDTIKVEVHTAYHDAGVKLSDNYYSDSALRPLLTVKGYVDTARTDTYQVVYSVTDPSGNGPVTATRTVMVIDDKPPVIKLKAEATVTAYRYKSYTDSGYTVTDNYDSIQYISVSREGSFATFNTDTLGLFKFRYKAEDRHHNVAYSAYRYILVTPYVESIEETKALSINLTISPNPADNQFTVQDKSETLSFTSYILSDITGRICQQENVSGLGHKLSISTAGLPSGIYLLTLFTSYSSYTYKVIVKH